MHTIFDQMKFDADSLDRSASSDLTWTARGYMVDFIHWAAKTRKTPFNAECRLFVKKLGKGCDLPDLDRILTHAGFGGDKNRLITVRVLWQWNDETNVPAADTVKGRHGFYTAREVASIVRDSNMACLPHTVAGIEKWAHGQLAGMSDATRARFFRNQTSAAPDQK